MCRSFSVLPLCKRTPTTWPCGAACVCKQQQLLQANCAFPEPILALDLLCDALILIAIHLHGGVRTCGARRKQRALFSFVLMTAEEMGRVMLAPRLSSLLMVSGALPVLLCVMSSLVSITRFLSLLLRKDSAWHWTKSSATQPRASCCPSRSSGALGPTVVCL